MAAGLDLVEALGQGVEHGQHGVDVGGAHGDVDQLGRDEPGAGQGVLEVRQRARASCAAGSSAWTSRPSRSRGP